MCLNIHASIAMSVIGVLVSTYVFFKMNFIIAFGIFYFTLMEIIQAVGYTVVDECDNKLNQAMAYLNYIHISFQPFVFTLFVFALLRFHNLTHVNDFSVILFIELIASFFFVSRLFGKNKSTTCNLCGPEVCVKSGKYHIKIETPLRTDPEYYTPNLFIHFLFFFIPILFLGPAGIAISIFIFVTFIIVVKSLKLKANEASTTWCFISVAQLTLAIIFVFYFGKK